MKLLQICNKVPWPLNDGGNIAIHSHTQTFIDAGHQVFLYCLNAAKHKINKEEALAAYNNATVVIEDIDTSIKPVAALNALINNTSYNVSRFYSKAFESKLAQLLKKENIDVVQFEGTFTGPYVNIVKENSNALVSVRMHNAEFEIWSRLASNTRLPLKRWYLQKLSTQLKTYEAALLNKVDTVVTLSPFDLEKFKTLSNHPTYYNLPAAVDLDRWQYKPTAQIDNWYHLGNMEWHANKEAVNWLVKDIHPLISQISGFKLHLAGRNIKPEDYQLPLIKTYQEVSDAVDFVSSKDVCIVPLKSGSGIRIKILEAMAAGKLVISTTVGAQGIEYENGKHLLIADTPKEYYNLFKRLKNGEIDFKSIVKNARALIEDNYSKASLSAQLLAFYSKSIALKKGMN